MVAGAFVTFEGIDGSGKSTQLRLLAEWLRARGREVVTTREPGGTPLGVRLRAVLLDAAEQVDPLAELLLYAADRAQHVRTLLRPALEAGRLVLSDRYADATVAYQGAGRGFAPELIAEVVALATGGLKPDLTLVFDLPVADCLARTRRRGDTAGEDWRAADRIDSEAADFHQRVREAYLQLAAREPTRVRVLPATGTIHEIHALVLEVVRPILETK